MQETTTLILVIVGLVIYFLPTIVSFSREHHQDTAIFFLNLLLGWTLLGWVAALGGRVRLRHAKMRPLLKLHASNTNENSYKLL